MTDARLSSYITQHLAEVDLKTKSSVHNAVTVEHLGSSITNVQISAVGESPNADQCLHPVLEVAAGSAGKLSVGKQTTDSDTSASVLARVQLPTGSKQAVNSGDRSSPADGQLATLVLKPEHVLFCGTRGGVTLGVTGHKVEADVALESGSVGASPVISGWDRLDGRDLSLKVLGQTDKRVAFWQVVPGSRVSILIALMVQVFDRHIRALDIFNLRHTAPDNLCCTIGGGSLALVVCALSPDGFLVVVHHVVDDPWRAAEDQVIVRNAA